MSSGKYAGKSIGAAGATSALQVPHLPAEKDVQREGVRRLISALLLGHYVDFFGYSG